jgi:Kelch motif
MTVMLWLMDFSYPLTHHTLYYRYNDDLRVLDTDSMIWARPRVDGQGPTGRYGHSAKIIQDGKLIVFGGWGRGGCQSNEEIKNNDAHSLHVLDINKMVWHAPVRASKKSAKHVFNHGACVTGNTLLTFGGYDGKQSLNDFIVMNIDFGDA